MCSKPHVASKTLRELIFTTKPKSASKINLILVGRILSGLLYRRLFGVKIMNFLKTINFRRLTSQLVISSSIPHNDDFSKVFRRKIVAKRANFCKSKCLYWNLRWIWSIKRKRIFLKLKLNFRCWKYNECYYRLLWPTNKGGLSVQLC